MAILAPPLHYVPTVHQRAGRRRQFNSIQLLARSNHVPLPAPPRPQMASGGPNAPAIQMDLPEDERAADTSTKIDYPFFARPVTLNYQRLVAQLVPGSARKHLVDWHPAGLKPRDGPQFKSARFGPSLSPLACPSDQGEDLRRALPVGPQANANDRADNSNNDRPRVSTSFRSTSLGAAHSSGSFACHPIKPN